MIARQVAQVQTWAQNLNLKWGAKSWFDNSAWLTQLCEQQVAWCTVVNCCNLNLSKSQDFSARPYWLWSQHPCHWLEQSVSLEELAACPNPKTFQQGHVGSGANAQCHWLEQSVSRQLVEITGHRPTVIQSKLALCLQCWCWLWKVNLNEWEGLAIYTIGEVPHWSSYSVTATE